MKPPLEEPGQKKSGEKENRSAKITGKLDDMKPAKDVKGGRTKVKDSHDPHANT